MQHDGRGSHGLLNVVTQDTALKGRVKRPFLICANLRYRTVGVFKPRSPCQDSEAAEVSAAALWCGSEQTLPARQLQSSTSTASDRVGHSPRGGWVRVENSE